MTVSVKRLGLILLITALILCIPLIAMQFTPEVNWSTSDFIVAGLLLGGVAVSFDLIRSNVSNPSLRTLLLIALIMLFVLVWAELAVGIFGSPFAGS